MKSLNLRAANKLNALVLIQVRKAVEFHLRMSSILYLDTARLGRMCPESLAADHDFARLAGEEGCSLYFEQFLQSGFTALPPSLARQYPGLSFWAGVTAFKNDLKTAVCLPRQRRVLIANRSAQLVRLAARLLCQRCENILVTDMEWPAYVQALKTECHRTGRLLTTVPMQEAILRAKIDQGEAIDRLLDHYRRHNCDGLFLSAVTYQGVQLPIRKLVQSFQPREKPRFVVVDGAQALNHVPLGLADEYCDLLLAGCHKWLRAYHPLGLAFCCRQSSEKNVTATLAEMQVRGEIDDPLLTFTNQLETQSTETYSETVNLVPMFTAAAAVRRMLHSSKAKCEELAIQQANADRVADEAGATAWRPLRPTLPMQSGVLLVKSSLQDTIHAPPDIVRQRFLRLGITLTAYDGGLVRTSLPSCPLRTTDLDQLRSAFM